MLLEIVLIAYAGHIIFYTLGFMFWYVEDALKTRKNVVREFFTGTFYGCLVGVFFPYMKLIDLLKKLGVCDALLSLMFAPVDFLGKLILG